MTIRMTLDRIWWGFVCSVALLAVAGCGDLLVEGRTLQMDATGVVEGAVFFDFDGNHTFGSPDPPLPGIRMRLLTADGSAVVDTVTSGALGVFRFPSALVGDYRLGVDPVSLADSFIVVNLENHAFTVEAGRTVPTILGLTFPLHPPLDVRSLPVGQRIFTRGVVLNVRATPGDGVVHIREGDAYLRLTQVPPTGLNVGDTVRVKGRTARSAGQPVLEDATIFNLGPSDQLLFPIQLGTLSASQAAGGTLDAALVRIENAAIQAALPNQAGHLVVTVDDGSGPVEVVLRNFLGFSLGGISPGTTQFTFAIGLLVPVQDGLGTVRWQLTPRGPGDLDLDPIGGG